MKKTVREQKAITLVALIITIIILLVLATVSINLVINGGIIDKTKSAVDKYSDEEILEQIKMSYLEYEMAKLSKSNLDAKEYMQTSLEKVYGDNNVTITKMGLNLKIDITGRNKTYTLKHDGTIKENERIDKMAVTPTLYEYLDEDSGTLYLRATPKINYLQVLSSNSGYNWPNIGKNYDKNKIIKIIIEEPIAPNECISMFNGLGKLTKIENIKNLHTENVTSMLAMFAGCSLLEELDVSNFDTSKVTKMSQMFWGCKARTLDLSNFDTRKVTNMSSMFGYNEYITELDLSSFDTSNVTTMESMFFSYTALTKLDLSGFNTNKVTNMRYMFIYCNKLETIDLSNFNTDKVTNMEGMFQSCSSINNLDLRNFNTSAVTTYSNMFSGVKARIRLGEHWNSAMTAQSTNYSGTQWNT